MVGSLLFWIHATTPTAFAAPLPVAWESGVHIYTHPEDWRPNGVGDRQLAELETTAQAMHTPIYVVLIRGESLPGTGDGQQRLQAATDALMVDWGEQGLDLSRYSVFTVAWGADCDQPPARRAPGTVCEYFLNTGSDYIHGPAHFLPSRDHAPITNEFRSRVARSPQDPAGGIRNVIQAADQRIWPYIDPVQVRKRAEQALQASMDRARVTLDHLSKAERASLVAVLDSAAEVQKRDVADELHQMARTLDEAHQQALNHAEKRKHARYEAKRALKRLDALLMAGHDLPADIQKAALEATRDAEDRIDKGDSIAAFEGVLAELETVLAATERAVEVVRTEELAASRRRTLGAAGGTGAVSLGIAMLGFRRRRRNDTLDRFQQACSARTRQLEHAMARYTELELSDRDDLAALDDAKGITAYERDDVRTELDAIYAGIKALESALQRARTFGDQAGALDVAALERAITAINAPFDYDTGQLANDQLFTGRTRSIHIHPPAFMQELQDRFAAAVSRRDRLREAAALRFTPGVALLPHADFDDLEAAAERAGVPVAWLSDHPLYGDDDSDQDVWAELDAHRATDPLQTLNRLDTHRSTHASGAARVGRLQAALQAVAQAQTPEPPAHPPTVMDRTDDPAATWTRARTLHQRATSLLEMGDASADADALVARLTAVARTYADAKAKARALSEAVRTVDSRTRDARSRCDRLTRDLAARGSAIDRAAHTHVGATQAETWLTGGRRALGEALRLLATARAHIDNRRHLDALRTTETASERLDSIGDDLQAIDEHLESLEALRRRYERARSQMRSHRRTAERKIADYGEAAYLEDLPSDATRGGATDFAHELAKLRRIQEQWTRSVRRARSAHNDRLAKAAAAVVRASRSSSSSSWSSSSGGGSSFGSSSSSGGGSSFGSSGSSGGGGGW